VSLALATPPAVATDIAPLRDFVTGLAALVDLLGADEAALLPPARDLLARLIARDDWLPDAYAQPHPDRYQQYLLHCDSAERFSVVAFVWGPGQGTPIHDHRVWGLVGVLRGEERAENFGRASNGALVSTGPAHVLRPGEVEVLSPAAGDIHRVHNGLADAPSISIHVYGGNIGAVARATYDLDGTERPFISGYANRHVPNLWDRSNNR